MLADIRSHRTFEVRGIRPLTVDAALLNDGWGNGTNCQQELCRTRADRFLHFRKLRPVHSTAVVILTRVEVGPAHMRHVLVFTENDPPLGTSGVLVVVIVLTQLSKSTWTVSSLSSHLVCFGPTLPFSGLMYDMFRDNNPEPSGAGDQSDTCMAELEGQYNIRPLDISLSGSHINFWSCAMKSLANPLAKIKL